MFVRILSWLGLPADIETRLVLIEARVTALEAILGEHIDETVDHYERDTLDEDKKDLLYQMRRNLTKLKLRLEAYGWQLGLANQIEDYEERIESLETELEFRKAINDD